MKIVDYRRKHSMSQSQFADLLTSKGISATQSLISQYELGAVEMPPKRALKIEEAIPEITRHDTCPGIFGAPSVATSSTEAAA